MGEQESLLFSLKIDGLNSDAAVKKVAEEIAKLRDEINKLSIENAESAKQVEAQQKTIDKMTASMEKSKKAIEAEEGSITKLREANKKLTAERNATSTTTEAGRAKVLELNKALDANNEAIKANVDGYTKQKLNIGNYGNALQTLAPGLAGTAQGIGGMTKASLTFIATPIGAILGALGAVLLAVTSYLKGSEGGMDKFAKISAQVGAVISVLTDRLIMVGEAIFDLLSGNWGEGLDKMKNSFEGVGDEIAREVKLAGELADILDALEELELRQTIRMAEQGNAIQNLMIQSKNLMLTEEQRMAKLKEAHALEVQLAGEKQALHLAKMNAAAQQLQMDFSQYEAARGQNEDTIAFVKRLIANEDIVFDKRKALAEQLVAYNDIVDESANIQEKILAMQSKVFEAQRKDAEAANKAKQKELEEELKRFKEWEKADRKRGDAAMEREFTIINKKALLRMEAHIKELDDENKKQEKLALLRQQEIEAERQKYRDIQEAAMASTDVVMNIISLKTRTEQMELNAQLSQVQNIEKEKLAALEKRFKAGLITESQYNKSKQAIGEMAAKEERELKRKAFEGQKKNQVAATWITTLQSAVNAFNSLAPIPFVGPVLGSVAAAAAILFGKRQVNAIKETEFTYATGGITGTKIGPQHGRRIHRDNGDNLLATVKTGEVILNRDQQRRLGGDRTFAAIGVPGFAMGGFTGGQIETRSIAMQSDTNRVMQQMLYALENQPRQVLVLEEFEAKVEARDTVETKATL